MNQTIQVSGLSKRFGSTTAVDSLDWSAHGGVIGLLGPNGAGKTTLLRVVATVLAADRGEVRMFGLDPAKPSERLDIRRRLGYLPQHAGLYPGFSAFDLVEYVAVLKEIAGKSERRDATRDALTSVGLEASMHKRIRSLSGGMQRRVALAAALVGGPELLVLDEPAAGLDPDQRLRLRGVLSDVGRRGTVLLSTHQTDEIAAFCQRVVVMHLGTIRFDGTPSQLADVAVGRVWVDEAAHPDAIRSWVTADGDVRNVGSPPSGAEIVPPTVDDGFLLLVTGQEVSA